MSLTLPFLFHLSFGPSGFFKVSVVWPRSVFVASCMHVRGGCGHSRFTRRTSKLAVGVLSVVARARDRCRGNYWRLRFSSKSSVERKRVCRAVAARCLMLWPCCGTLTAASAKLVLRGSLHVSSLLAHRDCFLLDIDKTRRKIVKNLSLKTTCVRVV